ncbi:hypothetical protein [Rhodococcus sp. NCIMB 12038]|uniref:hypothetical protein n=1 Tax=Rhodococcus sp. NCIMB 12038 TaxID=933800 RepID=UPI000B3C3A5D|nr:hypothetical protein [Rhodococcus sp. NCIMB 12038]OUS97431.1 hypothetical protein CA951_03560 [Rhodococcus sp. NCIMB 12038]
MTDEAGLCNAKKDPIIDFGSIPGADGTTPESTEAAIQGSNHSDSAYEQVRKLLVEPGPPVGAGKFSEKMAEEMESFERRWSERPVPTLVSAGKKMADQSGSTGLNRLLGLPVPAADPDSDQVALDEASGQLDTTDTYTDEGDIVDPDVGPESVALVAEVEVETEPEAEIVPLGEDDATSSREYATGELGPSEPEPESDEDRTMAAAPTARMITAQTAYLSLNPLESEIFRSQMGLMDSTQFRDASTRSQELALETIHRYELETIDLQQQLETARGEAEAAEQEAVACTEALAAKVATLEGQLQLLTSELVAARREAADDDSEGGAGRELVKGHDDLRHEDQVRSAEAADPSDDGAESDHANSEEANGFEALGDEVATDAQNEDGDGDEGDGGMAQMLQLLAQGEDTPVLGQDFGE